MTNLLMSSFELYLTKTDTWYVDDINENSATRAGIDKSVNTIRNFYGNDQRNAGLVTDLAAISRRLLNI